MFAQHFPLPSDPEHFKEWIPDQVGNDNLKWIGREGSCVERSETFKAAECPSFCKIGGAK